MAYRQDKNPFKKNFTYADSLDIHNKQKELNVLADRINEHVNKHSTVSGNGKDAQRSYVEKLDKLKELRNLEDQRNKLKMEYFTEYRNKTGKDASIPNPFSLSQGNPDFYGSDIDVVKGSQDPWGANKYDPVKPTKPPSDKITREKQQKIAVMQSKNLEFIPIEEQEVKLEKAIPQELTESDHFTIQRVGVGSNTYPKGDDGEALIKLKDKAGREVFQGSQKEYQEKYGEHLQRGTKKYGEENLQRRLYVKK